MKDWTETMLVASCRRGDRSAYAELVQAHSARVFVICLGLLENTADAEDAAQQVLLRGFMQIKQLHGAEKFAAWIERIAKNYCLDVLRKQKRAQRALAQHAADQESARQEPAREYPELQAALSRLPEECRLALMLYYFDGRSAKSVAETFDITEAAVHARISRARKKLRELLSGQEDA